MGPKLVPGEPSPDVSAGVDPEVLSVGTELVDNVAGLVPEQLLPLRTNGRYIVDRLGGRVKWSCVNWHGGQQRSFVTGGLHRQKADILAQRIASLGFNCVRLAYSTEAVLHNPIVNASLVAANPELVGCTFLRCFDAVVEALAKAHIMVILNNHLNKGGWCCNIDQDEGFWYGSGFTADDWQNSVVTMARRYSDNPWVVAHDLRNEPHDYDGRHMGWGTQDPATDYKMAMERAGNAVLDVAPDSLIVIEGLCFGMELRPIREQPAVLKLPNRVVYEVHNYQEFQFSTLFNTHFYSWSYVRFVLQSAMFVLLIIMLMLGYSCKRLKWPWAPQGVFLVSFGSWIAGTSVVALGVCIYAHVFYTKYCHFIAEYDIKPLLILSVVTFITGVVLLTTGLIRSGRFSSKSGSLGRSHGGRIVSYADAEDGEDEPGFGSKTTPLKKEVEYSSASDMDSEEDEEGDSIDIDETIQEDLACFNLCVRGRVAGDDGSGPTGVCCFAGFRSCRLARRRTVGRQWRTKGLPRAPWDCGLCCMFQACIGIPVVFCVLLGLWFYAFVAPTYARIEKELDSKWGFVLEAGHEYTAPVWMGEFGTGKRGTYWVNFVRYLAERDVDWGYWPFNPEKLTNGYFDDWGRWYPHPEQWDEDSYSVLELDYMTVRAPWRQLDLHALRASPAAPVLNQQPCQRSVLGSTCGG
mmetsp:Transcript_28506/g.81965  ORF Transcript_28506/g.81965 Transcript_28506/m.81965 type:complete len:690 (+) Transcript_28506:48-2117(+)